MVNVCAQHFDLYKLPKSQLTNANILYLVRFGSSQNKLVQLLIQSWNSGGRKIRSLPVSILSALTSSRVQYKHARVEDVVDILKMKATIIQ